MSGSGRDNRQSIVCRICLGGKGKQDRMNVKSEVDAHFAKFHPEISPDRRIVFTRMCASGKGPLLSSPPTPTPKEVTLKRKDVPMDNMVNRGALQKELEQMKDLLEKREREINVLEREANLLLHDKAVLEKALCLKEEVGRAPLDDGQLKKALKEIDSLKQVVNVHEYDKQILKGEIDKLKEQMGALHYDKYFLDKTMKEKEEELQESRREKGELRATVLDQHSSIRSCEKKLTKLEAIKNELEEQLKVVKCEHEKDKIKFDEILEERKKDLEEAKQFMDSKLEIQLQLRTLDKDEKLEEALKEIAKLKEAHSQKDSHLEKLQREHQYLDQAHHELAEKYAALSMESRPRMKDHKLQGQYQSKIDELVKALKDSEKKRRADRRKFEDKEGEMKTAIELFKMEKVELERKMEALVFIQHPLKI